MTLTCPKCQADMRTYERNGVHVDQCTECRGIFLDRGELEKLVDAENSWHGESAPAAPPAAGTAAPNTAATGGLGALVGEVLQQAKAAKSGSQGHDRGYDRGYDRDRDRSDDRGYDPRYGRPKKKKSFLDELFG